MVIVANASCSVFSAYYGRAEKSSPFLFTAVATFVSCIFFFCYNKLRFVFDLYTLLMSCLFGVAYLTATVSNIIAMKRGSVGITSLIVSFSLLLPTLFGIVFWKEETSFAFYIGLLLLICATVLTNMKKAQTDGESEQKKSGKMDILWVVFVFLAFVANGACSIVQTYHQKTGGADYKSEFMIMALCIVCIVNLLVSLIMLKANIKDYIKPAGILGASFGVCNALVNLGVMLLASSGVINQSVYFPMISIGSIIIVFTASLLLFKEKFSPVQYLGIIIGIIAIIFLQI